MNAELLFPELVLNLQARRVPHVYRPSSHDLIVSCPFCGSKMSLDASNPFWLCLGQGRCASDRMTFEQVLAALVGKAGKA